MNGTHRVPVLIAGGGPVGLCLAMELGSRAAGCLLVNERKTTSTHPKGSTINARTMEHFRRLGFAGKVRKMGIPADHPTDIAYVTRLNGHELGRLHMPSVQEKIKNPGPQGETRLTPEPLHRANQVYVDPLLLEQAKSFPGSDIRFGWRLVSFTQDGDSVQAEIEEIDTGRSQTVVCDYLVGCDGGNGMVRRSLGFHYSGRNSSGDRFYDGVMISAYVRAPKAYEILNTSIAWHYFTINTDGRTDVISLDGKGEFLMLAEMPPGKSIEQIDAAEMFRIVAGENIPVESVSVQEWVAGLALVVDGYQKGRVFLAGDSAHLFTPAGGFGSNTGIDDVANLGWKLAAVCQGWGGSQLLDSYEIERRPIGIRNTSESGRLAEKIGALQFDRHLEEQGAAGEASRARLREELKTFKEEFASIGIQLGARYDGSPIIISDGTSPPPDLPAVYTPSACPGGRAPHYWIAEKTSLFDRLGPWFTLLRLGTSPPGAGGFTQAAGRLRIPLKVLDLAEDGARELYGANLALIRPDQHVAWRGDKVPEDIEAVLATVTGRFAGRSPSVDL